MARLGIGLIGVGKHGVRYATHICKDLPHLRLVGIARRNLEVVTQQAAEFGCRAYTDFRELLAAPDVDAVVVVVPATQHPEITFRSTSAEQSGAGSWNVHGLLTLHGQTKPVTVQLTEKAGHYVGHALLKQTDFGIKPVRVGGGTVRIKDQLRIEFDIQLTR